MTKWTIFSIDGISVNVADGQLDHMTNKMSDCSQLRESGQIVWIDQDATSALYLRREV